MCDNLAYFWQNFVAEKLVKNCLECVARENIRLENSYASAKLWLCAPKITKTRKLENYFPIIVNICAL